MNTSATSAGKALWLLLVRNGGAEMSCGCNGPGCDAWGCDGNPQFEWDGSFHDLCPNCDGTAPPHVECICRPLAEAEHRGRAQGQAALELVLDIAAKERPEVLNARFIWRRSKEILKGEK